MSLRTTVADSPAFDCVSSGMTTICRPSTPPAALISSTAITTPMWVYWPSPASRPVREENSPSRIGSGAASAQSPARTSVAPIKQTRPSSVRRTESIRHEFMRFIRPCAENRRDPISHPGPAQGSIVSRYLNFPFSTVMMTAALEAFRWASSVVLPVTQA